MASLIVPVLRSKLFLLSPAMQLAAALGVAALFEPRSESPRTRAAVGVGALAVGAALAWLATRWLSGGAGDYAHVAELVLAKLRYLGTLPIDPSGLPFGARLLWKGPFVTGSAEILLAHLPVAGVLVPVVALVALPVWLRGDADDAPFAVLALFTLAFAAIGILIWRTVAVTSLVAPVAAAALLARVRLEPLRAFVIGLAIVQAAAFASYLRTWEDEWYYPPHQAELRSLVGWMRANLGDDGAVVGDFVTSTAVLAHTRHAIVLQPKYETRRSRERIELFARALYTFPLADFHRVVRDDFAARYLVVDRKILWAWRYLAGLRLDSRQLPRGTAAAAFLGPEPADAPGFRLLHATTNLRLYEIEPVR
jgi:hypothetical protein